MGVTPSAARVTSRWYCQEPQTTRISSDVRLPRFSPTNEEVARQVVAKIDKIKAILEDATAQVWQLEGRVDKGYINMEKAREQLKGSSKMLDTARDLMESQTRMYHFDGT